MISKGVSSYSRFLKVVRAPVLTVIRCNLVSISKICLPLKANPLYILVGLGFKFPATNKGTPNSYDLETFQCYQHVAPLRTGVNLVLLNTHPFRPIFPFWSEAPPVFLSHYLLVITASTFFVASCDVDTSIILILWILAMEISHLFSCSPVDGLITYRHYGKYDSYYE